MSDVFQVLFQLKAVMPLWLWLAVAGLIFAVLTCSNFSKSACVRYMTEKIDHQARGTIYAIIGSVLFTLAVLVWRQG